ncbi:MAG TPA: alternative ribosome rescue aminoacyl-tRNA hydrolase ArfB [Anaerohalosphaeraceae bacterium]|nr:aminoacyl-tRNA hydrolase [Phycisphaerae bacterium]HOK96486.1 alternative ribosome rescue aminoacyl-tRNA hydrolase ArfB [Anaerohalosphaeraceae bacterium]HOL32092.1 alternative ribosome rescue aminoacyl-tRNA hydrolase ArfB [Anaerohalosphaeraceae bacterium]HOM75510.1 alternative ribosome rescue aminoacyl-tRNA hydrolase ArfB [Anaerohalosphaeraceae bacterium]HPC64915.1 alternative ribosome rescue aminoacyl-tRNA hydrolase ArfB [Anaerohalosphaeraceae bacterium]
MEDLAVNPQLIIPARCLRIFYTRSSGPGGQNVNKLNTRVQIFLDIPACACLSDNQKNRLYTMWKGRIDKKGVLEVSCSQYRSQMENRRAAMKKIAQMIASALKPVRVRKKTAVPRQAILSRLHNKKERSELKKMRSKTGWDIQ